MRDAAGSCQGSVASAASATVAATAVAAGAGSAAAVETAVGSWPARVTGAWRQYAEQQDTGRVRVAAGGREGGPPAPPGEPDEGEDDGKGRGLSGEDRPERPVVRTAQRVEQQAGNE